MGDETKTSDVALEAAAEAAETAVTVDSRNAQTEAPSKLRLASSEGAAAEAAAPAEPSGMLGDPDAAGLTESQPRKKGLSFLFGGNGRIAAGADDEDDVPKWDLTGSRARRQGGGVRLVNRVLAIAVVLILVFGVLDLFATIRQAPGALVPLDPAAVPDLSPADVSAATDALPVLANLLDSFSKRPIVRDLDRNAVETSVTVTRVRTQVPDWRVRAQKFDLIGLSGAPSGEKEAIVADRETGRMYILRIGQEMIVDESRFTLVRIMTDKVAFDKDGEEVIVE